MEKANLEGILKESEPDFFNLQMFYESLPVALLTYSKHTGLLKSHNDKITELFACDDIWTGGRSLFSLRQMFGSQELMQILQELTKIKKDNNLRAWDFGRKISTNSGQKKWLNFRIVLFESPDKSTSSKSFQTVVISVYDTTAVNHTSRSNTIHHRLDSLNENRRRNRRVKAVLDHVENEMEDLAFELHEELGVNLSHIKYGLQLLGDLNTPLDDLTKEKMANELSGICQTSINKIRKMYDSLAPAGLKEFGLETIVRRIISVDYKSSPTRVHLDSNLGRIRFSDFIELNYYRMAQELLDNSRKFSNAKNLYVILRYEYNRLTLMVADDGIGFNPNKIIEKDNKLIRKRVGNGLRNIQERCKILNCTFTIFAAPNEGCRFTIEKELRNLL